MKKCTLLLFYILLCFAGFSQQPFSYENIWESGIMFPEQDFKIANVKSLRYEEITFIKENKTDLEKKAIKTEYSEFDRNGYLLWKKNWDSYYINGGETISIRELDNRIKKVSRKIATADFIKLRKSSNAPSFWNTYIYYSDVEKKVINKQDSLEFVSYLQWLEDSSIQYSLYFLNEPLDEGKTRSWSRLPSDKEIQNCVTTVQIHIGISKDSIIHCPYIIGDAWLDDYVITDWNIKDGRINKVTMKLYKQNKLAESVTDFFYYDQNGSLSSIESKLNENILKGRTFFEYDMNGKKLTIKEEYNYGKLDSRTTKDEKGKILNKLWPAKVNSESDGKIIYSYYDNELIRSIEHWYGGNLTKEERFTYDYFN